MFVLAMEDGCVSGNHGLFLSTSNRVKLFKYAKWLLMILVLTYVSLVLWMTFVGKGQSRGGMAFESIAHEAFSRQYSGSPQMQVFIADEGASLCPIWNFEGVWGRCVVVVLHVRDYQSNQLPAVEREVMKLAEQLRQPCVLLSKLGLPNEQQLSRTLGCNASKGAFRLRVLVNAVMVDAKRSPSGDRPYRWWVTRREKVSEYQFKGEF